MQDGSEMILAAGTVHLSGGGNSTHLFQRFRGQRMSVFLTEGIDFIPKFLTIRGVYHIGFHACSHKGGTYRFDFF